MKIPRTWSLPSYFYDPEMAPSMEPLKACQIRSIEAVSISENYKDTTIWRNQVSTGNILLTVPTKALKYNALEWIVSYEDYRGMLMAFSVRKLIKAFSDNGEDPVKELDAVDAVGFRNKLFAKVFATTIFDNDLWDMLGVHAVECDIVDFGGTMEIIVNCHYSLLEIGLNDTMHQVGPSSTQAVGTANVDLIEHYLGPRSSAFVRVSVHLQNLQKDQTFMAAVKERCIPNAILIDVVPFPVKSWLSIL
ncbi:hypothetical protein SELMODRAFT_427237 [Selaginella moellendorffii]|uniref:Uncharacterized protein n=1 Tax=Selaginella moellendorffii TaxID=88036 RepID=D8SYZ3_SELML|nr:hypothetical protein SELMODRAFT_427237 [Selaginella moellendorffii]